MEVGDVIETVDHYSGVLQEVLIPPTVFFQVVLITVLIFSIRFKILLSYNIPKREQKRRRGDCINIFGHICTESLISIVVSYLMIVITQANQNNLILNLVVAPAIGAVSAIFIDHKFLIPAEGSANMMSINRKKSDDKDSNRSAESSSVVVNVGTTECTQPEPSSLFLTKESTVRENYAKLSRAIVDDPDFKEKIVTTINEIQDIQNDHAEHISDVKQKTEEALRILDKLRESEKINKKVTLKKMMYDCLDKGFATPQENDHITMYYASYNELGGDPEVTSLYEEHYNRLKIHEDRRILESPSEPIVDRRVTTHNCSYGQYDPRN